MTTLSKMASESNPPVPASDIESRQTVVVYENGDTFFQHDVNGVNVFRADNETLENAIHKAIESWEIVLKLAMFKHESTKESIANKIYNLKKAVSWKSIIDSCEDCSKNIGKLQDVWTLSQMCEHHKEDYTIWRNRMAKEVNAILVETFANR